MPLKIAIASFALMAFAYAGYPWLAYLISLVIRRPVSRMPYYRKVSIILAVHNEGDNLLDKIANLRKQKYPADRLEIIVVDDGSTDGSMERLRAESMAGVKIVRCRQRRGKAVALNAGVAASSGEVVVFTDARQDLIPRATAMLMENFADKSVAAVTGRLWSPGRSAEGFFRRWEESLRSWEASWGSCAGATGALYAVRRGAIVKLPASTILDDFVMSVAAARKGRLVYDRRAVVVEAYQERRRVWRRRLRTLAGNWQVIFHPIRYRCILTHRTLFQLFCHKVLRLLFPFFVVTFAGACAFGSPKVTGAVMGGVFAGAVLWAVFTPSELRSRVMDVVKSLVIAPMTALLRYILGLESVLWAK